MPPVDAKRAETGVEATQLRLEVRLGARDDGPDEPKRERDHAETERVRRARRVEKRVAAVCFRFRFRLRSGKRRVLFQRRRRRRQPRERNLRAVGFRFRPRRRPGIFFAGGPLRALELDAPQRARMREVVRALRAPLHDGAQLLAVPERGLLRVAAKRFREKRTRREAVGVEEGFRGKTTRRSRVVREHVGKRAATQQRAQHGPGDDAPPDSGGSVERFGA